MHGSSLVTFCLQYCPHGASLIPGNIDFSPEVGGIPLVWLYGAGESDSLGLTGRRFRRRLINSLVKDSGKVSSASLSLSERGKQHRLQAAAVDPGASVFSLVLALAASFYALKRRSLGICDTPNSHRRQRSGIRPGTNQIGSQFSCHDLSGYFKIPLNPRTKAGRRIAVCIVYVPCFLCTGTA